MFNIQQSIQRPDFFNPRSSHLSGALSRMGVQVHTPNLSTLIVIVAGIYFLEINISSGVGDDLRGIRM